MIRHVVMFRFKPDSAPSARQAMAESLAALPGQIPAVRSWSQGHNVVSSDRNYDFGLVADFDSREDLQAYIAHPAHQSTLNALILPVLGALAVVDFEL